MCIITHNITIAVIENNNNNDIILYNMIVDCFCGVQRIQTLRAVQQTLQSCEFFIQRKLFLCFPLCVRSPLIQSLPQPLFHLFCILIRGNISEERLETLSANTTKLSPGLLLTLSTHTRFHSCMLSHR